MTKVLDEFEALLYVLNDQRETVPLPSWRLWGEWMSAHERQLHVGHDVLDDQGTEVSTLFIGMRLGHVERAYLFETMAFFPDGEFRPLGRYLTYAAAEAGHKAAVAQLRDRELARR